MKRQCRVLESLKEVVLHVLIHFLSSPLSCCSSVQVDVFKLDDKILFFDPGIALMITIFQHLGIMELLTNLASNKSFYNIYSKICSIP